MAVGGIALKFLQWAIRGVQFGCCAVVLALTSYFLATLHNHEMDIATWLRAVEGISGIGVVYTAVGLLLLCCLAGFALTSVISMAIDLAFIGAFIYVAIQYRGGASSCTGVVDTPFGRGNADTNVPESGNSTGFTDLPSFYSACKVDTAALSVSIIAIFFFLFSIFVEILLVRHHQKEKKFGPSPKNGYTSGSGTVRRKPGMFSFKRKNRTGTNGTENALPQHTAPTELQQTTGTTTADANATNGAWHTGPKTTV